MMPRLSLTSLLIAVLLVAGCSPAAETNNTTERAAKTSRAPSFDGERAFDLIKKQVAFGPRVPNTAAHRACAEFIKTELQGRADRVEEQRFAVSAGGKHLELTNIIARFNLKAKTQVLLAAHWDTRPTADCEVVAEKQRLPIPGANDGGSGVAVLLELARMFSQRKPTIGIVMVFFDGEDYGPGEDAMFLGSKHFAAEYSKSNGLPDGTRIDYGVLLDMVGDADLKITPESHSVAAARGVVERVWKIAEDLGYRRFFPRSPTITVSDDHLPLIRAGIKCIAVIDFEYGPWHTLDDTPDKCSAKSLAVVGEVVAALVYAEQRAGLAKGKQ